MLQRLPFEYNLVAYSGAEFVIVFHWIPDCSPIDLTTWYGWMPIGPSPEEPSFMELSSDAGGLSMDADGYITISMSPDKIAELEAAAEDSVNDRGGVYQLFYDLFLRDSSGFIVAFAHGHFLVQRTIPRPVSS